jgi:hypothetical protein
MLTIIYRIVAGWTGFIIGRKAYLIFSETLPFFATGAI